MRRIRVAAWLTVVLLLAGMVPARTDDTESRLRHVIVIGMDNYHLEDIQAQMPNLWAFLQQGALSTASHHPDLPTKTAPDFSSIASGQYPDRHGILNNTFRAPGFRIGFAYWENLTGVQPPAFVSEPPWRAFNRAGWDVGAVGFEGLVLETKEEVAGHLQMPSTEISDQRRDQFWGLAVHRANGSHQFGVAEIPEVQREFPTGWKNGWDGPPRKHAAITLRMTTLMQAAGIPITFSYVENTHTRCPGPTISSCERDLPQGTFDDLLKADDDAFGKFFRDLADLGITPRNSLFVITTDEGDHHLPDFAQRINVADLADLGLGPVVFGSNALFYAPDEERLAEALATRLSGRGAQVATRAAMRALHIADGRDARTPTFMGFADPESTFASAGPPSSFRWNHGNIHPDITEIWLAIQGPGVRRGSLEAFSDQADIVPTIRALLGIEEREDVDGVAIFPALKAFRDESLMELREAFKQLNAPLGRFGMALLDRSTEGVLSAPEARRAADDRIAELGAQRDRLIGEMRVILDAGRGHKAAIEELLARAEELLVEADTSGDLDAD